MLKYAIAADGLMRLVVQAALEQLQSDPNSELEDASIPQEALACN